MKIKYIDFFKLFAFIWLFEAGCCFKLYARPKKAYKISAEIISEYQNDDSDDVFVELCFKNKSNKAVLGFSADVYISVSHNYEDDFDYNYDDGYDNYYSDSNENDSVEYGNYVFNIKIDERVDSNDKEVFIYPLGMSSAYDYEIDFIYVNEIVYEDSDKM